MNFIQLQIYYYYYITYYVYKKILFISYNPYKKSV